MALSRMQQGVYQGADNNRCGAASCVYVMQLLGVAASSDTAAVVMQRTSTMFGGIETLGSTPRNIAEYIKQRCRGRNPPVTIFRASGAGPIGNKGWRGWIYPLGVALLAYPKHQGQPGQNDALIRIVGKRHGGKFEAHFVVQTHFGGQERIMDPATGNIEDLTFQQWADGLGGGEQWCPLGLDMVVSG